MGQIKSNEIITADDLNTLKAKIKTMYENRPLLNADQKAYGTTANSRTFTQYEVHPSYIQDLINACFVINDIPNLKWYDAGNKYPDDDYLHSGDKIFGDGSTTDLLTWLSDAKRDAITTSSNHGCRGACVGICTGNCAKTCSNGCTGSGTASGITDMGPGKGDVWDCGLQCGGECTVTCGEACRGYCSHSQGYPACGNNDCGTTCYSTCLNDCRGSCYGCGAQCGSACKDECKGSCKNTCSNSCTNTCDDTCKNKCGTTCGSGCATNCSNRCYGSATGGCYGCTGTAS